ncbi:hypothetical protein K1719_030837 [Acacia pycnantha]|nr:hypothetical protein K1719_030837 [Acacia pycnantha]
MNSCRSLRIDQFFTRENIRIQVQIVLFFFKLFSSRISEQIYAGSCIQTEADVETLSKVEGVTDVLNFQSATEAENWGIDFRSINESCQRNNILTISYSIRIRSREGLDSTEA